MKRHRSTRLQLAPGPRTLSPAEAVLIWQQTVERNPQATYAQLLAAYGNACAWAVSHHAISPTGH